MNTPTLVVTHDLTQKFNQAIAQFKKDSVLIGIPSDESERKEGDPITNAAILAINHFGSDDGKIPPRPVLTIGIKKAQADIATQFKLCAQNVLKDGPKALSTYYERAGIIASSACKKVINDQEGIKPPAPATLKARQYITASGFKGTKSLLITAQMRNAITWVLRSVWAR